MPVTLLLRLLSIAIVVVIASLVPNPKVWISIVYSLGFAHYFLALLYSGKQTVDLLHHPGSFIPLASVVLFGVMLYLGGFSLVIYFGLHHAFNEAYVLNRSVRGDEDRIRMFRASATLLHLLLYFVLLRHAPALQSLPDSFLFLALLAAYAAFAICLYRIRTGMDLHRLLENTGFELIGIALVIASFYIKFEFLQIVLYHFVFWAFYPMTKMAALGTASLARYVGATAAATVGFFLISPLGLVDYRLLNSSFATQFGLWSFVHITSSFFLSNSHPPWIVNLFRPKTNPARLES